MSSPISVDLPHNLGKEEARRRMEGGTGKLKEHIPGAADVQSSWQGDRLTLAIKAMGQEVTAHVDVADTVVRVEVMLPGMLGFFGKQIEGLLRKQGAQMLEDKSKKG
jgi:putative polyhydroxyalkanoate system protein